MLVIDRKYRLDGDGRHGPCTVGKYASFFVIFLEQVNFSDLLAYPISWKNDNQIGQKEPQSII